MPCVVCGAPSEIPQTRPDESSSIVRRVRTCENGHTFRTVEVPTQPDIANFAVRRSSDNRLAPDPFSRATLRKNVFDILFKRKGPLDDSQIDAVVDNAIRRIERNLPEVRTHLTEEEYRRHKLIVGAIPDTVISDAVESELRERDGGSFRMAELLYAMAIHGRNDNRPGWPDAVAVNAWVQERHPDIHPQVQRGQVSEQPWPRLAAPRRLEWRPETVLKRDGQRPAFSIKQLRKGVHAALWGREDADAKALMVAHLVLSDIRGQRIVRSTQISHSVLIHLRRIDDIGYLRWATIVKNIRGIREFANEATDLIHMPFPPVQVTKDWRHWARAK
jgi:transcriptional regulator NrdR family protein